MQYQMCKTEPQNYVYVFINVFVCVYIYIMQVTWVKKMGFD